MATVISVSKSVTHTFSKTLTDSIVMIEGEGVEGDAHRGKTVKHRSRVKKDPTQPNLRQVHLIHHELIQELSEKGFHVAPGVLGENITTQGIDLLALPEDTILRFPSGAEIQITGLRNPCPQIENFEKGLLSQVLDRDEQGNVVRKAGIMGIVLAGGVVSKDDQIQIMLPPEPHQKLKQV